MTAVLSARAVRRGALWLLIALTLILPGCASQTSSHSTVPSISPSARTGVSQAAKPSVSQRLATLRPHIVWDPIPFGARRKAETAAYAERHYGLHTFKLSHPHVIVIHYTVSPDFRSAFNTFASDAPDSELHELPGTCAQFIIDRAGGIHQLVPVDLMCRHTVGLNWTAIGIEHVGSSDQQVLRDHRQMAASLKLVRWLRCRFHIAVADVIGHNESLKSRYHRERVPALRSQTHGDFIHATMQIYRRRLKGAGRCLG